MQWWKILPPTYKFFLIVIILLVLLVGYLYLQKLVTYLRGSIDDGKNVQKFIPNPELPLPPSASILHQFKHGVVCSGTTHNIWTKTLKKTLNSLNSFLPICRFLSPYRFT